jgi:hypothetical protein
MRTRPSIPRRRERRAAHKRAQERGSLKPDASELVREALDAWLAKPKKF